MQVPRPVNEIVAPATEQTFALLGSIVKTTARPEVAVAVIVYGGSFLSTLGGVEVIVIVCDPRPIVNDCCDCGAALYWPFPGWFASTMHVPAATKYTVEPVIVHAPALAVSIVNEIARPELAVAETV